MIIGHFRVPKDKEGLLAIAYPGWTVVREPLPTFNTDPELIVFYEGRRDPYPSKRIVLVNRSGDLDLSSTDGAIRIMQDRGVEVSKHLETLKSMSPEDVWGLAKPAILTGSLGLHKEEKGATTFNLFQVLFDGPDHTIPIFKKLEQNHNVIFSSLLTMMVRTKQDEFTGLSPGYAKALTKNKPHLPRFKRAVLDFMESPRTDLDFMAFLVNLGDNR